MESPRVTVRPEPDGVWAVVCSGEFDLDTTGKLAAACDRDAADALLLVLDVTGVTFADSSFLKVHMAMLEKSVQDAKTIRGEPATVHPMPAKKKAAAKKPAAKKTGSTPVDTKRTTAKKTAKKTPPKRNPPRSA